MYQVLMCVLQTAVTLIVLNFMGMKFTGRGLFTPWLAVDVGITMFLITYASDLLSYSRILALALSSAVIATVVNLLATMTGFSFGGIIFFIVIFTIGHSINFALKSDAPGKLLI